MALTTAQPETQLPDGTTYRELLFLHLAKAQEKMNMSGRDFAKYLGVAPDLWLGLRNGTRDFGRTLLEHVALAFPEWDNLICGYLRECARERLPRQKG